MEYSFAKAQVMRINRNWMIITLAVGILIATMISNEAPALKHLFGERDSISDLTVIEGMYKDGNYYTKTQVEEYFDTGYTLQEDNRDVKRYYGFWTEDGLILCLAEMGMSADEYSDYTVQGKIMEMDSVAREVRQEIVDMFQTEYQLESTEASALVSHYIVDTTKKEWLEIVLTIAAYLALAAAVLHFLYRLLHLTAYDSNKHYRRLEQADGMSAEAVNEKISAEYREPQIKKSNLRVTNHWVIITKFLEYKVFSKDDVVWIYHKITRHRWYGIIPAGKSYALMLGLKDGSQHEIAIKLKNQTEQTQEEMQRICPRAIGGYSEELESLFATDLESFVALTENRES